MANKKRGESNNAGVERFFKDHPNRTHRLAQIATATGLTGDQVRGAISYLNAKAKAGKAIEIRVVQRGASWMYVPELAKPEARKKPKLIEKRGHKTIGDRLDDAEKATMGPAQAARLLDAKGHEDKPITEAERRAKATRSALAGHQVVADQHGGIAEATRKSALGSLNIRTDRPVTGDDFARLTAELGNMTYPKKLTLELVGSTTEGYAIGKAEDGGIFKVVPL